MPIFSLTRPNPTIGALSINESTARSEYDALAVSLTRRLANHFQMQANYTLARNMDDDSNEHLFRRETALNPFDVAPEWPTRRTTCGTTSTSTRSPIFPRLHGRRDRLCPHRCAVHADHRVRHAERRQRRERSRHHQWRRRRTQQLAASLVLRPRRAAAESFTWEMRARST